MGIKNYVEKKLVKELKNDNKIPASESYQEFQPLLKNNSPTKKDIESGICYVLSEIKKNMSDKK